MVKRIRSIDITKDGSNAPAPAPAIGQTSLRETVKQALLKILNDESANAAAKASASRTLLEYFDDRDSARATRRGVDMTASELDAAIALLE